MGGVCITHRPFFKLRPMLVTSVDISTFDYDVLMDISGEKPVITLTNKSVMQNPSVLKWVFEIYSPGGTPIHRGNFSSPDRVLWTQPFVKDRGFPRPGNQIEWSGTPYLVVVRVQDALGNEWSLEKTITVCRPAGNLPNNKNTNGAAKVTINTRCRDAKLLIEDVTQYSYAGATGKKVSAVFELRYPPDGTGISRPPFVAKQFSTALVPISQSGGGYQYYFTSIVDYALADGVTVRAKYVESKSFPVYCNIDLSPIASSLHKLIHDAQSGNCADRAGAERKISLISAKYMLAATAILFPQDDSIEVYKLIEEINELGGWQCDCFASGVTPLSTIGSDSNGLTYEVVSDGGDVTGEIEEIAGGIRIHVKDVTYRFVMCDTSNTDAIAIQSATEGQQKTYCLRVDRTALADEVLQQFETNNTFKNRLNQVIVANLSGGTVNINARCLLTQSRSYTYTFTSPAIPSGQTLMVSQLTIGGVVKPINFLFDRTNPTALNTALNNLGIGTFSVTFVAGVLTISIPNVTQEITSFVGHLSAAAAPQELNAARIVSDSSSYTIGTVLQALADYVCSFTLSKIKAGTGLTVKEISLINGAIISREIASEMDLAEVLKIIVDAHNSVAEYAKSIKGVTCDNVRSIFPTTSGIVSDSSLFFGTDNNNCAAYDAKALARKILQVAATDPEVKGDFCAAQAACGKAVCNAVTNADAVYDPVAGTITLNITNTGALKYRVGYRVKALAGSSNPLAGVIAYKGVQEIAAAPGLTTSHVWGTIAPGTYEVQTIAVCPSGDSAPYSVSTEGCAAPASVSVTQANGNFEVKVEGLPANAAKFRVEILQPNGGKIAQNFATNQLTVNMPIPSGVYGNFTITARTVCNEAQGWYSNATAPVSSRVSAPATCPRPTAIEVRNITPTSAQIIVTKPLGGTGTSYTLSYLMHGNSTPQTMTSSAAGDTVTFLVTGLTENKIYDVQAVTNCASGVSEPYTGSSFATPASGVVTSTINNNGTLTASSVTLKVGSNIVAGTGTLGGGASQSFLVANNPYATLNLKVCDAGAIDAQVISNGQSYNPTSAGNGEFLFTGVNLVSPITVNFSNSNIP